MKNIKGLIFLLCAGSSIVEAKEWFVEPTSSLRVEFDDNIMLRQSQQQDAYGFVASLGANTGFGTELFNLALKSRVDFYQYWGQKNLDRENVNLGLATDYSVTERNKVGLDFDYIRDTSLTSELLTSGVLGSIQNGQVGRDYINVAPFWSYQLAPNKTLKATYAHQDVSYGKSSTSYLYSYLTDSGELSYSQIWTPKLQSFVSIGAMRYEMVDSPTIIDNYSLNVGGDYKYSETLSFNFMVGGRDTESSYASKVMQYPGLSPAQQAFLNSLQPGASSSSSLGTLFSFGAKKQYELGTLGLSYTRNTLPTAGGVLQQADSLNANVEHKLSEQLKILLSGSANFYMSTSTVNTTYNRDYFTIEPKVDWMFNRQLNLVGGYRYRTQQYDSSNVAATSNTFFVYLNYQWDKITSNKF